MQARNLAAKDKSGTSDPVSIHTHTSFVEGKGRGTTSDLMVVRGTYARRLEASYTRRYENIEPGMEHHDADAHIRCKQSAARLCLLG